MPLFIRSPRQQILLIFAPLLALTVLLLGVYQYHTAVAAPPSQNLGRVPQTNPQDLTGF